MAQQQKQPLDPYAQQLKRLTSTVQRVRGWVGSDPSRSAELGDALVGLTAYRLIGHAYADAAAEAQEAVVLSGKLLAAHGPIGPYTPVSDAVRYFTAAVHLAAIQVGAGMHGAAGRTMAATLEWQDQLRTHLEIVPQLKPATAVWALVVQARAALEGADLARANAYADAALDRMVEGGLGDVPDSYLALDVHLLGGDVRWAAGQVDQALIHDDLAHEHYERVVVGRLANPGRLSPALLARLSEPLFSLNRVVADRLIGGGEPDRGLVVRRGLIESLRGLTKRLGEPALAQLVQSLDDLAADLRIVGREDEAVLVEEDARVERARLTDSSAEITLGASAQRADRRPGRAEPLADWPALDPAAALAAATASAQAGRSAAETEAEMVRQAGERAAVERAAAQRVEEERQARAREELVRREAERAEAERVAAERAEAERQAAERAAAERAEAERLEAERIAAEEEAARLESKRRREERLAAHRLEEERLEAERREAERVAAAPALSREESERLELESLAAELAELERAEAEAARDEAARAEAARAEAQRAEQARAEQDRAEQARAEQARAEQERAEAERLEQERAEQERAEQERAEQVRAEQERVDQERAEQARAEAERLEQERAEQERAQQERAEQAERERSAAEEAERERMEAVTPTPEPVAESPAPLEPENAETEPPPIEPVSGTSRVSTPPNELDLAIHEWQAAKAAGERRRARAANERVVDLLRPRAEGDLPTYGPQLMDALEQLSSIRLRTGDIFGARAPSKEAKAIGKALGL